MLDKRHEFNKQKTLPYLCHRNATLKIHDVTSVIYITILQIGYLIVIIIRLFNVQSLALPGAVIQEFCT